jgi:hypothetical protein
MAAQIRLFTSGICLPGTVLIQAAGIRDNLIDRSKIFSAFFRSTFEPSLVQRYQHQGELSGNFRT